MSARPDALVSARWVAERLGEICILEVQPELEAFAAKHLPAAQRLCPRRDLQADTAREVVSRSDLLGWLSALGASEDAPLVLYDAADGRFACYAHWVFTLRGIANAHVLDGGLRAWTRAGHETSTGASRPDEASLPDAARSASSGLSPIRARRGDVLDHLARGGACVDARTPAEFAGVLTNETDAPQEGILRGGHLPGAQSIPHHRLLRPDGTFEEASALRALFGKEYGLGSAPPTIVYSRAGYRACVIWFALACVLGFERVRVYDGSWAEWGNLVGVPIARGAS